MASEEAGGAAAAGVGNWSTTLEELLDDGETGKARGLLEGVVAELQCRWDAPTNLTLAAAFSDLASLYHTLGLPSLAHAASSSALLIRQTAHSFPTPTQQFKHMSPANSQGSSALNRSSTLTTHPIACCIPDTATSVRQERSSSDGEEEWENLLSEGTAQLEFLSLTKNASESPLIERNVYKQRGRGAFTHGEMGMHIDRVTTCLPKERKEPNTKTEEGQQEEAFLNAQSKVTYGVRHVLVVSFSPSVTTKDLEELFERFGSDGVAIRWVNDTTALAVFRNPETAKDALQSTRSPHFRLKLLADEDSLLDLVKEKDLQPPVPRPATSSRAAHRMIMGALQRQGGRNKAPYMSNFKTSQQQEFERKQRLQTRQKLREEAWGTEDSN